MADLSIAIIGAGGHGVVTMGQLLLSLCAKSGWFGLMRKSYGAQIRGGESAVFLRLSQQPVDCPDDDFDLLLALDWDNAGRFADEIPLRSDSLILYDEKAGDLPDFLSSYTHTFQLPLSSQAKQVKGGRLNMVALGVIARWLELDQQSIEQQLSGQFKSKGESVVESSVSAVAAGWALDTGLKPREPVDLDDKEERWQLTGNEASGLGALRGGVRFVAAYPITPASDLLEWMAPQLEKMGGALLQAEDELASINAIIGSSWGGTPSMTATSGPGLGLMVEALGLAVASETPVVVVNVMRGGPSTGIPTKSEQTDLNIALNGLHGDAPHLVVAPLSISDAVLTTQWATHLAEELQTPAIVLTDQFLGQSIVVTRRPPDVSFISSRKTVDQVEPRYNRYAITADGVSPMAIPGTPGLMYTADGLEHDEHGKPSSRAADHLAQLKKRQGKLDQHDYGEYWGEVEGDPEAELAIITWGSSYSACREAAQRLNADGLKTKVIALRLLMPLPKASITSVLTGCTRYIVVEQNFSGQLFDYLHSQRTLPHCSHSIALPGPLTITPGAIVSRIRELG